MYKKVILVIMPLLLLFFAILFWFMSESDEKDGEIMGSACLEAHSSISETSAVDDGGGGCFCFPPAIHVDGLIFSIFGLWGTAKEVLDDSFVFVGTVLNYAEGSWSNLTENFQANYCMYVGARLYRSGQYLIVEIDGQYTLFRQQGRIVEYDEV